MTFGDTFGMTFKGRVSAATLSSLGTQLSLPLVAYHASGVGHAVLSAGENAGVFKLLQ